MESLTEIGTLERYLVEKCNQEEAQLLDRLSTLIIDDDERQSTLRWLSKGLDMQRSAKVMRWR